MKNCPQWRVWVIQNNMDIVWVLLDVVLYGSNSAIIMVVKEGTVAEMSKNLPKQYLHEKMQKYVKADVHMQNKN